MFYVYANDKLIYRPMDHSLALLSPRLTLEIGKAGSFEMGVPPYHKFYDDLRKLKTIIRVELDDNEILRSRILSYDRNFNNIKKVYCEGDLAYLVDSVQKAEKYVGTTHELFRKIIEAHNAQVEEEKRFEIGIIGIENREIILSGQSDEYEDPDTGDFDYKQIAINSIADEWKTTYDYIDSCIIEYCGGYLRTRRENGKTYIDLVTDYGNTSIQEIRFGLNMLDLTEQVTAEEIFTVLIPLGDENLTIESVNGGSNELVDEEAVALYGRIVKTHVFDNVNQASTLLENGKRFLANHANIPVTITIKAIDLHLVNPDIEEIKLGDKVRVKSAPHKMMEYLTCTRIEYDLENPSNNSYTFGNPRQTLTERYRRDKNKNDSSGGSGGGGAGAAADQKAKEELEKFYDAWINCDPESAHIDLGAVYRELKDAKDVLEREVGISLDAATGNVNIKSLRKEFDELGQTVENQAATIDLLTDETQSKIELLTGYYQTLEGVEAGHYASLVLRADVNESAIEMKADKVTVDAIDVSLRASQTKLASVEDTLNNEVKVDISTLSSRTDSLGNRISASETKITSLSNDTEAKISAVATRTSNAEAKIASIEISVTDLESSISLKADKTTLNSRITTINGKITDINTEITNINSEITNVKKLVADDIEAVKADVSWLSAKTLRVTGLNADNLYSNNYISSPRISMAGALVATQNWVKDLLEDYSTTSHSHAWSSITGKPTTFTPASHTHSFSFSKSIANGHTHKVTVNGTSYTSAGVSVNATHKIEVSGTTGSN